MNSTIRDNSKLCAFHNDYGHLMISCRHLMWEVEDLINKGYLKEFMSPSQEVKKEEITNKTKRRNDQG